MGKKGFTLIELITTIVIMSLIAVLVVPNVLNTFIKGKEKLNSLQKQQLESSFEIFLNDYCYNPIEGNNCPFQVYLLNNRIVISPDQTESLSLENYISYGYLPSNSYVSTNCEGNIKINSNVIDLSEIQCSDNKITYVKDGLILHYDAIQNTSSGHNNTTTTWYDLSGNNNSGTLTKFNFTSSSGWTDKTLVFDSDDIVKTSTSSTDFSQFVSKVPFTYSASFKTGSTAGKWQGVLTNMTASSSGGFNIQYGTEHGLATYISGYGYLKSGVTSLANTSYNIYCTYDGRTLKIYVNGILKKSVIVSINAGNAQLTLGWFYSIPNLTINGQIYNVLFYNRALTETEIQQNYNLDKKRFNF